MLHTYHAIGKSLGRFYRALTLSWLKEEGQSPRGMITLIHGDLHANNIFLNNEAVYLIDNESMLDSYLEGGSSIDADVVRFLFFNLIHPNYFSDSYFKEDLLLHARYIHQYIEGFSEEYKNKEETKKYLINIVEQTLSKLIQFTKDIKRNRENINQSSTSLPQVDNKLQEKFWDNKTFEKISSLTSEENKLKGNFIHFTTRLSLAGNPQEVIKGLEEFKTYFKSLLLSERSDQLKALR